MKLGSESYGRILDNLHDGLYFVDSNRIITYWNKAAERVSGFTAAEVIGKSCKDNILTHVDGDGCSLCLNRCPLAATISDGADRKAEVYMHHKDGHRIPVLVRVSALRDSEGKVIGGIELFTDISSLQANNLRVQELEKLAMLDRLTQLANRHYLERELRASFVEYKRIKIPFGILFIDIDHFKIFNDTYGHEIGDEVLRVVARTFIASARPFDLYGRWGGEEFLGIIRNIETPELTLLAERLRRLIEQSYIFHEGEKLHVTISLGATTLKPDESIESMIRRADLLLYESKRLGRNRLTLG